MRTDARQRMLMQELLYIQSISADRKNGLIEIFNVSLCGKITHPQTISGFLFDHVDFLEIEGIEKLSFEKCHFSYCKKPGGLKTKDCDMVNCLDDNGTRCPPPSLASPVSRRNSLLTSSFDNSGFTELCAFNSQHSPVSPVRVPLRCAFFENSFGNSRTHSNSMLTGADVLVRQETTVENRSLNIF